MKRLIIYINTVLILTLSLNLSLFSANDIQKQYEWLVFVFMSDVNDLGAASLSVGDINEMERIGSTDKVAVVAETNAIKINNSREVQFSPKAVTYFIVKDTNTYTNPDDDVIVSERIDDIYDTDMGSYRHFVRSAKKAIKMFNPQKLMIIVWNHGNGYYGIAYDDVSGNNITLRQLRQAFSEISGFYGRKIDIVAFDACLMQMVETVTEIKDYTNYVIASEETIPGRGYPYDDLLSILNRNHNNAVSFSREFIDAYVDEYENKNVTLSVVKSESYPAFLSFLNGWVNLLKKHPQDFVIAVSTVVTENSMFFSDDDNTETSQYGVLNSDDDKWLSRSVDLISYLKNFKNAASSEKVKTYTDNFIKFLRNNFILYHNASSYITNRGHNYRTDTYGIAIYLPLVKYNSGVYEGLNFSKISLWDEFIKSKINYTLSNKTGNSESDVKLKVKTSSISVISGMKNVFDSKKDDLDVTLSHYQNNSSVNIASKENNSANSTETQNVQREEHHSQNDVLHTESNINEHKNSSEKTSPVTKTKSKKEFSVPSLASSSKTSDNAKTAVSEKEKKGVIEAVSSFIEDFISPANLIVYRQKIKEFELEIKKGNPIYAGKLLSDEKLQRIFKRIDRELTEKLIAYAMEIAELEKEIEINSFDGRVKYLHDSLKEKLKRGNPVCELNLCVPPDNVAVWAEKYKKYDKKRIDNIKIAVRQWDKVFSNDNEFFNLGFVRFVSVTSDTWKNMTVTERDAVIREITKKSLARENFSDPLLDVDDESKLRAEKYTEVKKAVDAVSNEMLKKNILSKTELDAIRSKPLKEQMYILANLFDRGGLKSDEKLLPHIQVINASRQAFPNEVVDNNTRKFVSAVLNRNIKSELSKTQTGKKLVGELKGNLPYITVDYTEGFDSKVEGNHVIVNAKIVEEFLKLKGYSTEELVKDRKKQLELTSYLSPLIAKNYAEISVRNKIKGYTPEVREIHSIALLYQAKYTQERFKDNNFKEMFTEKSKYSDYSAKVVMVLRDFEKSDNEKEFVENEGSKYYAHLSTSSYVKGELIIAVKKELERRKSLNKESRAMIDKYAIFSENDIYRLKPQEIVYYIQDINTDALKKLEKELLSKENFDGVIKSELNYKHRG